jgi:DUF1365 family protein
MYVQTHTEKLVGTTLTVVLLLFAAWLVSPFFHLDRSSYGRAEEYGYRLAVGVTIMIVFVGKWAFDALAPQGLARKVSNTKAVALILLSLVVMGFVVFVVAQAASLYLRTAAREAQQQSEINQRP